MRLSSARRPSSHTKGHRRYPRVELSAEIGARIIRENQLNGDQATAGALTILGVGGAFLLTRHVFEVGTPISVRFALPDTDDAMECDALIRTYIPHRGIGIEFVRISPGDRSRLQSATWELADSNGPATRRVVTPLP